MFKRGHFTDRNLQIASEKPENFKDIGSRYESTDKTKSAENEFLQTFENILGKKANEEFDDTTKGQTSNPIIELSELKTSTDFARSNKKRPDHMNRRSKSDLTQELEKAVAQRAKTIDIQTDNKDKKLPDKVHDNGVHMSSNGSIDTIKRQKGYAELCDELQKKLTERANLIEEDETNGKSHIGGPTPTDQKTVTPTDQKTVMPTDQKTVTSSDQKTVTQTKQKTVTQTEQKTVTPTDQKIATSSDQKPVTQTEQKTVTPTDQKTATPTDQKTVTSSHQKTVTQTKQKTVTQTEKKTVTLTDQKTATPTDQKTVTSSDQKTVTQTKQKTVMQTDQKTVTPTNQKIATSSDQKTVTSSDQKNVTQTKQKTVTKTEQKTVTPTDQKTVTSSDQKTVAQTEQKTATPTDQKTVTQTDQKTENDSTISDKTIPIRRTKSLDGVKTPIQKDDKASTPTKGTKNRWSYTDGTWIKKEVHVKDDSVDQQAALEIKQVTELKEDSIDIKKQEEEQRKDEKEKEKNSEKVEVKNEKNKSRGESQRRKCLDVKDLEKALANQKKADTTNEQTNTKDSKLSSQKTEHVADVVYEVPECTPSKQDETGFNDQQTAPKINQVDQPGGKTYHDVNNSPGKVTGCTSAYQDFVDERKTAPEIDQLPEEKTESAVIDSVKEMRCKWSKEVKGNSRNQQQIPDIRQVPGKKTDFNDDNKPGKADVPQNKPTLPPKPKDLLLEIEEDGADSDGYSTIDRMSSVSQNESGVFESSSGSSDIDHSRIEYMLDVYMQFIKHQVKVTDVIDHLHFLSDREKDIVLSKHNFCQSDAFELLIEMIKKNEFKGKWQTFRNALDIKEFQHIKLLIDGKTEMDHTCNRRLLKLVKPELAKRIDVQSFLDIAFEKELLTDDDKCLVDAQLREHGESAAVEVILDKIHTHKKDWNTILIEILQMEKFCLGDIAELFKDIEMKEQKPSAKGTKKRTRKDIRSKSNIEMDWRYRYFMEFDNVSFKLSMLGNTEGQNGPTSDDFKDLTLEMRKLRETIEKLDDFKDDFKAHMLVMRKLLETIEKQMRM
ncbi:caldesmon-like isoform X2 [Ruditapes philippinarum]|uniref:caldesmon-like isoform X2 n=1 Tax=Ruditapes philippinarum TaxID=129788 RepID=UPI00295C3000|nr:caldesmon-like isoform X2 [Ruditapes philippinarum]